MLKDEVSRLRGRKRELTDTETSVSAEGYDIKGVALLWRGEEREIEVRVSE